MTEKMTFYLKRGKDGGVEFNGQEYEGTSLTPYCMLLMGYCIDSAMTYGYPPSWSTKKCRTPGEAEERITDYLKSWDFLSGMDIEFRFPENES